MKHFPFFLLAPFVAAALSPGKNDACGAITRAHNEAVRTNTTSSFSIPGATAQSCLKSMPFDKEIASQFLVELRKYLEFQSTLEALQAPPKTYLSSAIDILGGLDKIAENDYSSQYDFDTDINNLINSANDGHLSVSLCSLGIFRFGRPAITIASVSKDGIEIPDLYTLHDSQLFGSGNGSVSPIVSINGEKAADFLNSITKRLSSQDPHARYNSLFPSRALFAGTGSEDAADGAFAFNRGLWPGSDITSLQFKNGTTRNLKTIAVLASKGFNITSGVDLFKAACIPRKTPPSGDSSPNEPEDPPGKVSGPAGYPKPHLRDPYNQISGFYLDDETAVLFIPSFNGEDLPKNQSKVFADVATKFVADAIADGRSKLIIDVSGNGGGNIVRAFDLFKLFFPDKFPYSGTRFRRHHATESLANIFAVLNKTAAEQQGPLSYAGQVTPDQNTDFKSLDDFLGTETQLGVKVSSLFANFNYTDQSIENFPIRGYGPIPLLNKTAPFKPENIIIIGDGTCASTCTTFTNLMTNVGGVRTVAFGGNPKDGPMQIMGGVRGAQSASLGLIDDWVASAGQVVASAPAGTFPEQLLEIANRSAPLGLKNMPLVLNGGGVNFRNAYQEGKGDLPLQFEYQAADCRLFYTAENYIKPHTTWKAAKAAIWGSKGCVKGSSGGKGSHGHNGTSSGGTGGSGGSGPPGGISAGSNLHVAWSMLFACLGMALYF